MRCQIGSPQKHLNCPDQKGLFRNSPDSGWTPKVLLYAGENLRRRRYNFPLGESFNITPEDEDGIVDIVYQVLRVVAIYSRIQCVMLTFSCEVDSWLGGSLM